MFENLPDMLTAKQLQDVLSIGRSKTYRLLREGGIPYVKIGRQIRVPKSCLIDFVSALGYNMNPKSSVD